MINLNNRSLCENCFSEITAEPCSFCGFIRSAYRQDPVTLQIGSILNQRYKVGGVIGKGGFGITYLGYDIKLDARIAIKEYYPMGLVMRNPGSEMVTVTDAQAGESFRTGAEKFYNEAKMVAKFNGNPNIVSVHDFFYENDTVYFIMGYLQGQTLKSYLEKKKITEGQAVNVFRQISNALLASHSLNILHRDISPDNIMLCDDNSVRLLDFGAARQVVAEQSQSFSVILKQGFAPLEQYQQKGKQGPWTDIYALGATVYYSLTKDLLLDPMSRLEDDSDFDGNKFGISDRLWNVIAKCMRLKISDRYQSISELKEDLQSVGIAEEGFTDVDTQISDILRVSDPNATMLLSANQAKGTNETVALSNNAPLDHVTGSVLPQPEYRQDQQQAYRQDQLQQTYRKKGTNPLVIILLVAVLLVLIFSAVAISVVFFKYRNYDARTEETYKEESATEEVKPEETGDGDVFASDEKEDATSEDDASPQEDTVAGKTEETERAEDVAVGTDNRLERAEAAYDEKNYGTAYTLFRELADEGNAEAQTDLAFMYHTGTGVDVDYDEAVRYYRAAAAQGNARGQELLGIMYYRGLGVDQDYSQAAEWFRKAAEQGDAEAQSNLGWVYINGLGVDVDYAEAYKWCKMGAEQGNTHGEYNFGLLFENGYGVKKDISEARKWYEKAAAQGNNDAIEGLQRLEDK